MLEQKHLKGYRRSPDVRIVNTLRLLIISFYIYVGRGERRKLLCGGPIKEGKRRSRKGVKPFLSLIGKGRWDEIVRGVVMTLTAMRGGGGVGKIQGKGVQRGKNASSRP